MNRRQFRKSYGFLLDENIYDMIYDLIIYTYSNEEIKQDITSDIYANYACLKPFVEKRFVPKPSKYRLFEERAYNKFRKQLPYNMPEKIPKDWTYMNFGNYEWMKQYLYSNMKNVNIDYLHSFSY